MPIMEIVRCALTLDTTPPTGQYGWVVRGVVTWYCLPFRSPGERERFVRLLADHVAATAPADERDTLAALLCLSRSPDEAAYNSAVASWSESSPMCSPPSHWGVLMIRLIGC